MSFRSRLEAIEFHLLNRDRKSAVLKGLLVVMRSNVAEEGVARAQIAAIDARYPGTQLPAALDAALSGYDGQ